MLVSMTDANSEMYPYEYALEDWPPMMMPYLDQKFLLHHTHFNSG